jgi:ankyrin repeat protein
MTEVQGPVGGKVKRSYKTSWEYSWQNPNSTKVINWGFHHKSRRGTLLRALIDAADAGDTDRVRELLVAWGTTKGDSFYRRGVLYSAAEDGNATLVKMLIKVGAESPYLVSEVGGDAERGEVGGWTPLHIAACNEMEGYPEVVKTLVEAGAAVDMTTKDGSTSLHLASQYGYLEVVKELIKSKAKVDQATVEGRTPLLEVMVVNVHPREWENKHLETVKVLLEAGAVDQADESGSSALHIAAEQGNVEVVKLLTGFRPNPPGWTTFLAAATSKKELAASLAPPGERPPMYLRKIFDRAYLEPIWKFQRERYSDVYLKNGDGETALEMAEPTLTDIQSKVLAEFSKSEYKETGVDTEDVIRAMEVEGIDEDQVRDAEHYLRNKNRLHLSNYIDETLNPYGENLTRNPGQAEVAKLLRDMMVLPKEGKGGGEKKEATKGGKN